VGLPVKVSDAPNVVYGRLLEAAHFTGYGFERVCTELEWLLDDGRWREVGPGYDDVNAFLASVDLREFDFASERTRTRRQRLARKLVRELEASQRQAARTLGVGEQTVARDLGKDRRGAPKGAEPSNEAASTADALTDGAPKGAPAWLDASGEDARRLLERDAKRPAERPPVTPPPALPGTFQVIYADPPWRYEMPGGMTPQQRAVERHYTTMSDDEIVAELVERRTARVADDAICFLWATNPKLPEALHVLEAWGFTYRTNLAWMKDQIGMGFYVRGQHELLLIGRRGDFPVPSPSNRPPSVLNAARGRHSAKPVEVYELIERMYPDAQRAELFARSRRPGWASWGAEA
jgi:N6-adenosine-specific RNA methylase IME4